MLLSRETHDRPPGPRGIWPLGVPLDFQSDPLRWMERTAREYGDIVSFSILGIKAYLLSHPDYIQRLLVGGHAHVIKDPMTRSVAELVGQGLVISEGDHWRRQRRLAAPTFRPRHIQRFGEVMVRHAERVIATMGDEVRDLHVDMMRLTGGVVVETMFGADDIPDVEDVAGIIESMMTNFIARYMTWRRVLPGWVPSKASRAMVRARRDLDRILQQLIERRRAEEPRDETLLDRLLAARDAQGQGMSDEQLRDEVATMFVAGHETTALAISFAIHLLAQHPATMQRLRAEIDAVLDRRRPEAADIPRLPYTDAVLRESMRLLPPSYAIGREVVEDLEVGRYTLPRGAQVFVSPWVVHRDPRWFEDPERFAPERWLDGLAGRLHRFAYFPFGGGPRVCVGNHFAMMEGVLVLARLCQTIDWEPALDYAFDVQPSVTLRPIHGVRMRVSARARPYPS